MKKRIAIMALAAALCITGGCSQESIKEAEEQAKDIVQETTDQAASIMDSDDIHVLTVKNGHPESYPGVTYGEAFDSFFGTPAWNYFEGDGGEQVVEFAGYCTYMEVEVKARLQFLLNTDGTFSAGAFSLNDVPQTQLMTAAMLEKVFSQYSENKKEGADAIGSFDDVSEEAEDSTEDYPYLEGFIQTINSFSDPPEFADETYYKGEYDRWRQGEGYPYIAVDENGNVYIDDQSASYNGQWWDMVSTRCYMDILSSDGMWYSIDINWSSGAADNTHWVFNGYYDSSRGGIVYSDGRRIEEHYTEGGGLQETVAYSDGSGFIYLSGNTLYWEDDKENTGEGRYFEKEQ